MKKQLLVILASLLPSIAFAGTFTIDIHLGPGADFQEVTEALSSPLVVDGDTLLIRPGSYKRVISSKSVTMRGLGATAGDVNFKGDNWLNSIFEDCTGPIRFSDLEFRGLYFENCTQPIHLIDIEQSELNLDAVAYVRVENEILNIWNRFDLTVSESNAEFIHCYFWGAPNGGSAANVRSNSDARFADCHFYGGPGGDSGPWIPYGGDGGPGLVVSDSSRVQLIGAPGNTIQGGAGGYGASAPEDGAGGPALSVAANCTVRLSNFELTGGWDPEFIVQAPAYSGPPAALTRAGVPDPLMLRKGSFAPGDMSTFFLFGEPGAPAIAFFGMQTTSTPLPGIIGALATNFAGPFLTGQLNGSGRLSFNVTIPPSVPMGTLATMQSGMIYTLDGSTRLSNPTTIFVP